MDGKTEQEIEIIKGAMEEVESNIGHSFGDYMDCFLVNYTKYWKTSDPHLKKMVRNLQVIKTLYEMLDEELEAFLDEGEELMYG